MSGRGEYRPARCLDKANAPQQMHWAPIDGDPRRVSSELAQAIRFFIEGREALEEAMGQMRALIGRVEQCVAVDPEDIVNITRDRELWELRLDDQAQDMHVRVYCTQIAPLPHVLIALHVQAKDVSLPDEEILEAQNDAIDEASRRWRQGREDWWGLR